jgi:hypothetical protein
MRHVLREYEDATKSRMQAVAEREVDDAVSTTEGHGRFGAFSREWIQA